MSPIEKRMFVILITEEPKKHAVLSLWVVVAGSLLNMNVLLRVQVAVP